MEEYLSADGYAVTIGARFWDNNLRVVEVTQTDVARNAYSDTGETQTWHDTTSGWVDTLSGRLYQFGRMARHFEGRDASDYPVGTSYAAIKGR
jgi:hypothetical protein